MPLFGAEVEKRVRAWRATADGACWRGCPARDPIPCGGPRSLDAVCDVTQSIFRVGMPCPVYRLRMALGLDKARR
jgi:hypothetical protein